MAEVTDLKLSDFQIGDRVVVVDYDIVDRAKLLIGHEGTVVGYDRRFLQVAHDEPLMEDMGTLDGKAKPGCGWVYYPRELNVITCTASVNVDDLI